MTGVPRVVLRKKLGRAIRGGQPWIYRDALAASPAIADGAVVLVAGGDGRPLARGFWDATSPIAVRVLGGEADLDVGAELDRRVTEALARRLRAIDRAQTNAFRWVHGEADALPGVHVDVYGAALNIRYDGGGARAFYRDLPTRLREVAARSGLTVDAICERRPRQGGNDPTNGQAPGNEAERTLPLYGALPDGEIEIRENGLLFGADLRRGQKGGLFLDQRDNRALVRTLAPDRRVLNLFGYTGGFSIYAAAGGARETTTVDLAAPAIAAARRNFERNSLPMAAARFAAEDAFAFLTRAAAAGERFESGHLRSAELRPQPPRARDRPPRLPAPAPPLRGRHRAGRPPLRRLLLEPRRPRRVRRHGPRRRPGRRPARADPRDLRRRLRPPGAAAVSGRRLPEIRGSRSMMAPAPMTATREQPLPVVASDPGGPLASPAYRWSVGLGLAALQSLVYFGIGHAHLTRSTELLRTRLDDAIPFWPWTAWCYLPFYAATFLIAIGGFRHRRLFDRTAMAVVLVMCLGALGHLFVGAEYPRPVLYPPYPNLSYDFMAWVQHVDPPGNVFPSLHVAHTTMLALLLLRDRPRLGLVALAMATLLALSTLTTKQHFIADVVAGYALAALGRAFALSSIGLKAPQRAP